MKKALIILALAVTPILSVFAQEKPKVVLFHMHGCSACKHFAPMFDKMASKYSGKFNFTKEDANSSNLANQLNVNAVPVVFIIDSGKNTEIGYDCLETQGCFEQKLQNY